MKLSEAGPEAVWLPLTPARVARLAFAPVRRVLAIQALFAAGVGLAVAAFLASAWFPVVQQAVESLPEGGVLRAGRLEWGGANPEPLAANAWLALSVDLQRSGLHRFPSDLHVEFARSDVRLLSLAGYLDVPYPGQYAIAFNRTVLEPWWDAREPFLVVGGALLAALAALASWMLLGCVYAVPGVAMGRFITTRMTFGAAWKLASAAQMPGGLAAAAAVFLYSLPAIDLVTFLFIFTAQFAAAWIYLFLALFFLPAKAPARVGQAVNPFRK